MPPKHDKAKKGGDGEAMKMPVPQQSRRREPLDLSNPTWSGLETSKSRLAAAMDRCEYLASSRNRFTEVAAHQTKMMYGALNKASPKLQVSKGLSQSVPDLRKMLEDQRDVLAKQKTISKRLEQLSKYVIDKEGKSQGEDGTKAAKASAKLAIPHPLKDSFDSPYDQLAAFRVTPKGLDREWPLMAVACSFPYTPNEMALTHGRRKDGHGSTMSSSTNSMRKTFG
mmetsp:Transcript_2972/g.5003  ORF Transcript_2972/g.5003 Transcript_2972/m.5003 type:complete len:225 (+) Transcript_2972:36-710(+)